MELDARDKTESAKDASRISQVVKKACVKVKSRGRNDSQKILSCFLRNLTRNVLSRSKSLGALNNTKYSPKQDLNNRDKLSGRDTPVTCDKSVEVMLCLTF